MKIWKQITVMAIIVAIITIVITFTACNDGDEKTHIHEWENWIETSAPTITEDGVESISCKTCGEIKETRTVDAFAKPFFGKWASEDRMLTITASFLKDGSLTSDSNATIDDLVWEAIDNNYNYDNFDPRDEFPSGYKVTGLFYIGSSLSGSGMSNYIFINSTKDKLWRAGSLDIYNKQE